NPELAEVAQRLAIPIPDSLHTERLTGRCLGQWSGPAFHMCTVRGRDRITMRIVGRMAQERVNALEQTVADCVFQYLSLRVHVLPGDVERPYQEFLDQPMPSNDGQGVPHPVLGQRYAMCPLAGYQIVQGEALQHRGHCGSRYAETLGEARRRCPTAPGDQFEDRFEIVLDGLGVHHRAACVMPTRPRRNQHECKCKSSLISLVRVVSS